MPTVNNIVEVKVASDDPVWGNIKVVFINCPFVARLCRKSKRIHRVHIKGKIFFFI